MLGLLLVTLAGTVTAWVAAHPNLSGQPKLYLLLLLAETPLALLALFFLRREGTLRARLMPRPGDVLRGVSMAGILVLVIWSARAAIMPHGAEQTAWLARLYLLLGDPLELEKHRWLSLVILGWAVADEIVWRAWLQSVVTKRYGTYPGLFTVAAAYTLQTVPLAYLLRDATSGYNPLIPLLALGTSLAWSYLTTLSEGRAFPAVVSHATLAYFTLLQFRPGL